MSAHPSRISAALLLLLCLACQTNPSHKNDDTSTAVNIDLDAIKKRGYINALVDNNSISYFIYKGHPMGYEYELLQRLCKELGVTLKIKVTSGVERAIEQLNRGDGDILAFPLTINKPRKKLIAFTQPHFNTYQVLVQRKPDNWPRMTRDQINDSLIRNPVDLIDKEVHVIEGTSYALRLHNLSEELGGDINVIEDSLNSESESLIRKVALGEIDYTVSDHTMARVNAAYYPNLDVNTVLSVPQQIAWGVRLNSPKLLAYINDWLVNVKKEPTFMVIYNRYFRSPRTSLIRMKSDYSSLGGTKLSPYDDLIKEGAKTLGWDWRLLAAVIYQESRFNPDDESWAGAQGLMQLMPATARQFGAEDLNNPRQSIRAGTRYLKYLDGLWEKTIYNKDERLKFVLASYNVGLSHIIDARELAKEYEHDPTLWNGNVEKYLLLKSEPQYYQDSLVKAGYCKCEEPVNYVRDILERYHQYQLHYPE